MTARVASASSHSPAAPSRGVGATRGRPRTARRSSRRPHGGDLLAEAWRLHCLGALEDRLRRAGYTWIAGVDEAGRGALAGPVVAAAVVLGPDDPQIPGVDDSKRLDSATRTRLAHHVRRAHRHAVVAVAADAIDRSNILLATRRAMRRALGRLPQAPDAVLVDAVRLGDDLGAPVLPLIKGDALSYAIAAASVLAKVARDAMMTTLDRRHPHYGFADHKGYGAARHREALRRYGPTAEHRLSFRTVVPRRDDDRRRARAPMRARAHAAASPPLPRVR